MISNKPVPLNPKETSILLKFYDEYSFKTLQQHFIELLETDVFKRGSKVYLKQLIYFLQINDASHVLCSDICDRISRCSENAELKDLFHRAKINNFFGLINQTLTQKQLDEVGDKVNI